jgi:hypothetical protein
MLLHVINIHYAVTTFRTVLTVITLSSPYCFFAVEKATLAAKDAEQKAKTAAADPDLDEEEKDELQEAATEAGAAYGTPQCSVCVNRFPHYNTLV